MRKCSSTPVSQSERQSQSVDTMLGRNGFVCGAISAPETAKMWFVMFVEKR